MQICKDNPKGGKSQVTSPSHGRKLTKVRQRGHPQLLRQQQLRYSGAQCRYKLCCSKPAAGFDRQLGANPRTHIAKNLTYLLLGDYGRKAAPMPNSLLRGLGCSKQLGMPEIDTTRRIPWP